MAVSFGREPRPSLRWRVLVALPPDGLGSQFALMRAWLDAVCGPGGWDTAPAGTEGVVNDALAFYFADSAHARAFVGRFGCGYRTRPCRAL